MILTAVSRADLSLLTLAKQVWKAHMARKWGQPLANSQLGTEAFSPSFQKELNSAKKPHKWASPVEPSDESPALTEILIAAFWENLEQRTQISYSWIPNNRNCKIINICYCKSLCYGKIGNQYRYIFNNIKKKLWELYYPDELKIKIQHF